MVFTPENKFWSPNSVKHLVERFNFTRLLQSVNIFDCNETILSGIVNSIKFTHLENAPYPILVTLFGMLISVKPVQPSNAPSPIIITLFGMLISVKPVQPKRQNYQY